MGRGSRLERQRQQQQPSSPLVWSSSGCYRLQAARTEVLVVCFHRSAWLVQEVDPGHLSAHTYGGRYICTYLLWVYACTVLYVCCCMSWCVISCHYLSLSVIICHDHWSVNLTIIGSKGHQPNRVMYVQSTTNDAALYVHLYAYVLYYTDHTYICTVHVL